MKRSVAITGPTPSFVRWTLVNDCQLRQIDVANLPDRTFRQLRNLRALSDAIGQRRLIDGYCVHPDADPANPQSARGFAAEEVFQIFGDAPSLDQLCGNCPANVLRERPSGWAGCYGWLASDLSWQPESRPETGQPDCGNSWEVYCCREEPTLPRPEDDLIRLIEERPRHLEPECSEIFGELRPLWYAIWRKRKPGPAELSLLSRLLMIVAGRRSHQSGIEHPLGQFIRAIELAVAHQIPLELDYVPPGYSDGSTWTIFAHCPECGAHCLETKPGPITAGCRICGWVGRPLPQKSCRVLGLRPYMLLHRIIGLTATDELLKRHSDRLLQQP